jgi:maltose alpha-D-glucosyltransferase/alpha-amylase
MLDPRPAPAPDSRVSDDRLWYKDAVIYELHIKAFFDANGDGVGDFEGLIQKLDYVRDLGVNTIWLLPFYPSPLRDDGYDVADFMAVNPTYGSAADVARLVAEAHKRGLRVITELVLNHTSDQHPWFQRARRAPKGSPERDFYVWSDNPQQYAGTRIIFTDTEKSNWTFDEVAGQYFWHRFFSHQPDLNYDNPQVREAVFGIMEFWLEQGVDGFRLDAIPYLIEREGTSNENLRETHEVIKQLRARLDAKYPGKLFLAEANMWPEDVREYFGDDDECHMCYHFPLMPRMYMAIAQEDRHPVVEILAQTPEISPASQWAIFLRNHDELTLEMVTSRERDYMWNMYAADPRARINLGIRRRLAPLLENDRDRIKLMKSLLLSMPGSPVLYYGDEIGMGDNIFLGDRDGVRTPMQWTSDRNGGFSRADPQRLYLPPIQDPIYGYEAVNVEAQQRDASSLLNWTRRMLAMRASSPVFGRGRLVMLHPGNRKVLAYLRELDSGREGDAPEVVLCVANISRAAQPVELDLSRYKGRVPVEMSGHNAFPPIGDLPYLLTLPGYGFYWFRLALHVAPPEWHTDRRPVEDLAVLVLFDGWNSLFRDRVVPWRIAMAQRTLAQFESELAPRFLRRQRWFGEDGDASAPARATLGDHALLEHARRDWLLTLLDTPSARWFVPLALAWEENEEDRMRELAPVALAKARTQAQVGLLGDALADLPFVHAVIDAIARGREIKGAGSGRFVFEPAPRYAEIAGDDLQQHAPLQPLGVQHGTVVAAGERLVLKLLRRIDGEGELMLTRQLSEAGWTHCAPLAGSLRHVDDGGQGHTLALLMGYVHHQGDAFAYAVEQLIRQLERPVVTPLGADPADGAAPAFEEGLVARIRALGARTADLHATLARAQGVTPGGGGLQLRIHGALRLQEVLLVHDDFVFIDFDGTRIDTPLADVTALVRSLAHARVCALQQGEGRPEAETARREALSAQWLQTLSEALVAGYAEGAVAAGLWRDAAAFDAEWQQQRAALA